jgi:hypothetical protein
MEVGAKLLQIPVGQKSVPPAVAGGGAAITHLVAAQLRSYPLPQVVLTLSKSGS